MKYFIIFALFIFLGVMFYLDIIKYFIDKNYFSGLKVVPVLMMAELFFGIFFNLSLWYKLTDKTTWGMWFSLLGLLVTVVLNVLVRLHGMRLGRICKLRHNDARKLFHRTVEISHRLRHKRHLQLLRHSNRALCHGLAC